MSWTRLDSDFEDFVVLASPVLRKLANRLTGGSPDAEDLLQSALLRVARNWRTAKGNPVAYARRVLVNLATDGHRWRSRRPREVLSDKTEHLPAPATDLSAGGEEREVLLAALRELPHRMRAVIVLRYWEDLSVEETCLVMDCPAGTVKSLSARGLKRLRSLLEAEGAFR